MFKRVVDWMEKFSVGSLLVGLFQNKEPAVVIGIVALSVMIGLQLCLQRRER